MTNMDEKHLVAIDLGTSKFTLTVARVNGYDIQIVYYKEVPAAGIRNSYVLNPSHVARTLRPAIESAERELQCQAGNQPGKHRTQPRGMYHPG